MNLAPLQAFVQSFNGTFTILVGTVVLILGLLNEILDRNHGALLWIIRIVLLFMFIGGAAGEAAAWFSGAGSGP